MIYMIQDKFLILIINLMKIMEKARIEKDSCLKPGCLGKTQSYMWYSSSSKEEAPKLIIGKVHKGCGVSYNSLKVTSL